MQTSTHYGFNLPEADNYVNIEDLTGNWSSLDNILYNSGTKRVVCSTAASTAAKTASTSGGDFEKRTDAQIIVRFTNGNTAANPTLNIDNTGAAPIYVNGEAAEKLPADGVFLFVYNGTQFELVGGVSSGVGGGSMIVITDTTSEHEFEGDTVTATVGAYSESAVVSGGTATITGFMETGTVTITATDFSQTISITNYNKYTVSLVKPSVDMYVDWLDSIDESSASYSSLSDVLADEKMVRELFTRHASVDFLVSNVGNYSEELETIINNDYCAKWINLRDYALDTLYANQLIASLMDQADKYFYGEWTIVDDTTTPPTWGAKGNVPVMTSNTAPYGNIIFSSEYGSDRPLYYCFDGDDNTRGSTTGSTNQYIGYKFTNPMCAKRFRLKISSGGFYLKVQSSNDNSTWVDLTDEFLAPSGYDNTVDINNSNYYLYYRVFCRTGTESSNFGIYTLQFYGRELKVSVPKMTSNTAPYGEAIESGHTSSFSSYKAFDKTTIPSRANNDDNWSSDTTIASGNAAWVGYKFAKPVKCKELYIVYSNDTTACEYKLQGSNDGTNWVDILTSNVLSGAISVNSDAVYSYFRVYITSQTKSTGSYVGTVLYLNFYGLDYSEYDWDEDNPRHYIYDHGVELEEISADGYSISGYSMITGNKEPDQLLLPSTSTTTFTLLGTVNSIDFTDYSIFKWRYGSRLVTAGVIATSEQKENLGSNVYTSYVFPQFTSPTSVIGSVDITNLSAYNYIAFSAGYETRVMTLLELWLE